MHKPIDPKNHEELLELYSELQLAADRAAVALRLGAHLPSTGGELLERFQVEEDRAAHIWARIVELRGVRLSTAPK